MFDAKLAHLILGFLKQKSPRTFSARDINNALRLNKHSYKDLIFTLSQLAKQNELYLEGHHFGYKIKKEKSARLAKYGKPIYEERSQPVPSNAIKSRTANLLEAVFDATSLARNYSYAFARAGEEDVFISSEDTANAFHGDTVLLEIKYQRGKRKYGSVREVIKRARESFVGSLRRYQGKTVFICDNSRIHREFLVSEDMNAQEDDKVVLTVTNFGDPQKNVKPFGRITEILGKAGNPEVEVLGVIRHYGLPLDFEPEIYREIDPLPWEISPATITKRQDFRNILTFTIDPVSAKDYDDAISFLKTPAGFTLYVHIADVGEYVKPGMAVFNEAVNRGNSFYFPKKVIPMLPEKISNGICSLRPDEEKLVLTVITYFDHEYKIQKQEVCEAVILSDQRLNYEEVDQFFAGETTEIMTPVQETLMQLRAFSSYWQKRREKLGYLSLNMPDTDFIFNEEGVVTSIIRSEETESHKLIENCMLIANEYVARFLAEKTPCSMFRIHEDPNPDDIYLLGRLLRYYKIPFNLKKLEKKPQRNSPKSTTPKPLPKRTFNYLLQEALDGIGDQLKHRVFDKVILRSLKKAKYSITNLGHFGLAISSYTHFTSPIRRLCDLSVHLQLKAYLNGQEQPFAKNTLHSYSLRSSAQEVLADNAEREVYRVNTALFMQKHLGEEFDAIVIGMNNAKIFLELDYYPVEGFTKVENLGKEYFMYDEQFKRFLGTNSHTLFQLADRFKVQVIKASEEIEFKILERITPPEVNSDTLPRQNNTRE